MEMRESTMIGIALRSTLSEARMKFTQEAFSEIVHLSADNQCHWMDPRETWPPERVNRNDSDQTAHMCSLIKIYPVCIKKLLVSKNLNSSKQGLIIWHS